MSICLFINILLMNRFLLSKVHVFRRFYVTYNLTFTDFSPNVTNTTVLQFKMLLFHFEYLLCTKLRFLNIWLFLCFKCLFINILSI